MKDVETPFQDSQHFVTLKDTETNGGLNLTGKRAKPNNAGPVLQNPKTNKGEKQNAKRQSGQESRKKKAEETSRDNDLDILPAPVETGLPSTSTPRKSSNKSKDITRHTPDDRILETFQSRDLSTRIGISWRIKF